MYKMKNKTVRNNSKICSKRLSSKDKKTKDD